MQLIPKSGQCMRLSRDLTSHEHRCIADVLRRNTDLFAWQPSDMPGILLGIICIFPQAKPISQKKMKIGEERRKAVKEEVDKLLHANFIREVRFCTWLANAVMVKKANGKWRMCTDYTNLNRAYPKDVYPLPSINRLVDEASEFQVLTFLDAYFGYN